MKEEGEQGWEFLRNHENVRPQEMIGLVRNLGFLRMWDKEDSLNQILNTEG
jgi:hypothetical protein